MRVYGLEFTSATIDLIGHTIDENQSISLRALAQRVFQAMDWKAPSGKFKAAVCRKALGFLDKQCLIRLPQRHGAVVANRGAKRKPSILPTHVRVDCSLDQLGEVQIRIVGSRYTKIFRIWKELMDKYHYLGSGTLTMLAREVPDHPCTIFFEDAEWKAIYILSKQTKQLPAKEPSIRQAVRMLAGLGGFLGRKSDGEPGATTLWRGLVRMEGAAAVCRVLLPNNKHGP